jgi:hypothetical protein
MKSDSDQSRFPASDLAKALKDADVLLRYSVVSGELATPHGSLGGSQEIIEPIVKTIQAAETGTISVELIIAFWRAYADLSRIVRPVTADSARACDRVMLRWPKVQAFVLVASAIIFSTFLFMSNTTATDTIGLINRQNEAALRLWSDLQSLKADDQRSPDVGTPDGSKRRLPATDATSQRVFYEVVEFARDNAWLLQSASKLNFWFNPWWMQLDIKYVRFDGDNPEGLKHLMVPPSLSSADEVIAEGLNQIAIYQRIRDYAIGTYKTNTTVYGAITTYLLPTVYALLGAFLYGFRLYSRLIRRKQYLPSAVHSARYFIAAIAGLVIGLFATLIPKELPGPPLVIAFLVGYAVEAFFSRLDDVITRFKTVDVARRASGAEVAQAAK